MMTLLSRSWDAMNEYHSMKEAYIAGAEHGKNKGRTGGWWQAWDEATRIEKTKVLKAAARALAARALAARRC